MLSKKQMTNILVVEDDISLNDGIVLALKQDDFFFHQADTCKKARALIQKNLYHLILLDVNLPDGTGYDLLREIRRKSNIPVLMLTANDMEMDEVMGFELGASDYMTKPFHLAVLRARINNLLGRNSGDKRDVYELDGFSFDFITMDFRKDDREIVLSKTEQKLLRMLVKNENCTLSRETLIDRLWSDGAEYVDENALSVSIRRLREKVEENPSAPKYIQTVYGVGYVWKNK